MEPEGGNSSGQASTAEPQLEPLDLSVRNPGSTTDQRRDQPRVRMANGVFVLKPSYYHLMWVHKDSHIVERSAAVIWFTDALAR
ncbi:hypothetical protein HPB50_027003 [Hyalomma asiaticum]|uniref:Uncharacterized protein n=1 Tax=Hyalomma asiaticum TaxID=266040 RepID=A0ACB7TRV5_HYAAI|nr:hypothetical protein HPB50_027003 [Hyalomma asiaticum]